MTSLDGGGPEAAKVTGGLDNLGVIRPAAGEIRAAARALLSSRVGEVVTGVGAFLAMGGVGALGGGWLFIRLLGVTGAGLAAGGGF